MATIEQSLPIRKTAFVAPTRRLAIRSFFQAALQRDRDRRDLGALAATTEVGRATGARV